MISVVYQKEVICPFSYNQINVIVNKAARFEKKIKGEVEIIIVNNKTIRRLNRLYRGNDKATDVLSFAWQEDKKVKSNQLGQVYISYQKIISQAKIFNCPPKEEFIRMLIHGLLHLVGHDHLKERQAKIMFSLQEKLVKSLKNIV